MNYVQQNIQMNLKKKFYQFKNEYKKLFPTNNYYYESNETNIICMKCKLRNYIRNEYICCKC